MSTDPKIQAALEAAKIKAEMAKQRYPVLNPEGPQGPNRPPQPPGTPAPPRMAPGRQPPPPPTVGHVTPAPGAPLPTPAPAPSGGLQTASFEALLREVDRRKDAAMSQLEELGIAIDYLEKEVALRGLSAEQLEALRAVPTALIRERIKAIKAQALSGTGIDLED